MKYIRLLILVAIGSFSSAWADVDTQLTLPEFKHWNYHLPENASDLVQYNTTDITGAINVPDNAPVDFYHYWCDVETVQTGALYKYSAKVQTRLVRDGVGAMISLGLVNPAEPDQRLLSVDSTRLTGDTPATEISGVVFIPEGNWKIRLMMLLHGTGEAVFDNVRLERIAEKLANNNNVLHIEVTDTVIHDHILGFGIEDDCFLFTDENYQHGIDNEDIKLRENRIEELDPKVIATLFWWDSMVPEHDLNQITYDTTLMRALYRTLEVHQKAGRSVLFSDTHWTWTRLNFPYNETNVELGVQRYVELLVHLIKEKGFNCIRFVSISGEVDLIFEQLGGTFESYLKACALLREGLDKAGLDEVLVTGDKSGGFAWLEKAVPAGDADFGIYTIHEYPDITQYPVLHYRLSRVMDIIRNNTAPVNLDATALASRYKPAFLWEIGYKNQSAGDTDNNATATYTFEYGLLCAYTALASVQYGYVGGSVWCLHSMYYPFQNRMDFGLWEFKDKDWRIRPSYYGYGLLTRYIDSGMQSNIVRLRDADGHPTQPYDVLAVAFRDVNDTQVLAIVNLSTNEIEAHLDGFTDNFFAFTYTEDCIPEMTHPNYGKLSAVRNDGIWNAEKETLQIPAKAFVLLRSFPNTE